jgi:hypothetical protein
MDPLKIDIGAEIIDLVKRLGDPRRLRLVHRRRQERPVASPDAAPHDFPEPPDAA